MVATSHVPGSVEGVKDTFGSGVPDWDPDDDASTGSDSLNGLLQKTVYLGWLLGGLLVVLLAVSIFATASAARITPTTTDNGDMLAVAPGGVIERADIPEPFLVHYEGAAAHPDVFSEVPCFCGCDAMLGHRHLLDCFVRADDDGWEAHAISCGVCLREAEQVLALIAGGGSIVDTEMERSGVATAGSIEVVGSNIALGDVPLDVTVVPPGP